MSKALIESEIVAAGAPEDATPVAHDSSTRMTAGGRSARRRGESSRRPIGGWSTRNRASVPDACQLAYRLRGIR